MCITWEHQIGAQSTWNLPMIRFLDQPKVIRIIWNRPHYSKSSKMFFGWKFQLIPIAYSPTIACNIKYDAATLTCLIAVSICTDKVLKSLWFIRKWWIYRWIAKKNCKMKIDWKKCWEFMAFRFRYLFLIYVSDLY